MSKSCTQKDIEMFHKRSLSQMIANCDVMKENKSVLEPVM